MFKNIRRLGFWIALRTALIAVLAVGQACGLSAMCRADNYALIVGIDQYKQSQRINSLEGATNDARSLSQALQQVAGFPKANIRLLVSGVDPEPTASNIMDALDGIIHRIRPGDTLFVLYSGHGIDMDGKSYLVPWDADARSDDSLQRTVLPTSELRDELEKVPVKTLVMTFDMCRTDPRKGARDLGSGNLLGPNQARDLHVVPAKGGAGPQEVITLFACSEGERSWEWEDKQRGFFSYYLEQGLRHDAADNRGIVHASNLISYVQKAVYGAVEREEGEPQTPFPLLDGKDPQDVVLAMGLPAGSGGATAVTTIDPSAQGRFEAALQQGYEFYQGKQYPSAQARFQAALSLQPDSAKAANGLGLSERAQNNNGQAETYLRQAVQLDPKNARYATDLADAFSARGDAADAEPLYRTAMSLDPGSMGPVLSYANLSHKVKHDDDYAERLLKRAMRLDPKDPHPWDMMGEIYYEKGSYSTAENDYRHAVSLDLFGGQYLGHLAKCLIKENKRAEAQQVVDHADNMGINIPKAILDPLNLKSHLPKIGIFGL